MAEVMRYTVVFKDEFGKDTRVVADPKVDGYYETEDSYRALTNCQEWNKFMFSKYKEFPYRVVILNDDNTFKEIFADEDFVSTRVPKKINSLIIWLRS